MHQKIGYGRKAQESSLSKEKPGVVSCNKGCHWHMCKKNFFSTASNRIRCDSVLSSDFGASLRKAELRKLGLTAHGG